MKQFVPMTDEMLFDAQQFMGQLVPYRYGVPCARQMREKESERIAPTKETTSPPSACLPA